MLYIDGGGSCLSGILAVVNRKTLMLALCGGRSVDFQQTTILSSTSSRPMYAWNVKFILSYKLVNPILSSLSTGTYVELDYNTIEEGATCEWKIQGPEGTLLGVYFTEAQEYAPSPDYCTYHGVYFMDGSGTMLFYHCPDTNKIFYNGFGSSIIALSNVLFVRVHNVSQEAYVYFKFYIGYYTNSSTIAADPPNPIVECACHDPLRTITSEPLTQAITCSSSMTSAMPSSTKLSLTTTAVKQNPRVANISPYVGIQAGGTRITVTGQNFPQVNVFMTYGDYSTASLEKCSQTTCLVMTTHGNSSDIGIQLPISVIFLGQERIRTPFTFTYKPNPQVNSIHPLKTLAAGGTTLTNHVVARHLICICLNE